MFCLAWLYRYLKYADDCCYLKESVLDWCFASLPSPLSLSLCLGLPHGEAKRTKPSNGKNKSNDNGASNRKKAMAIKIYNNLQRLRQGSTQARIEIFLEHSCNHVRKIRKAGNRSGRLLQSDKFMAVNFSLLLPNDVSIRGSGFKRLMLTRTSSSRSIHAFSSTAQISQTVSHP